MTGGLQNRVALITGWASGIGQAIAIEFAKEGTDVMSIIHLQRASAEETGFPPIGL